MQIQEWASEILGMEDWWTGYMFDSAVTYFGRYIENKLMETDEHTHERVYTLEELLADTPPKSGGYKSMVQALGKVVG